MTGNALSWILQRSLCRLGSTTERCFFGTGSEHQEHKSDKSTSNDGPNKNRFHSNSPIPSTIQKFTAPRFGQTRSRKPTLPDRSREESGCHRIIAYRAKNARCTPTTQKNTRCFVVHKCVDIVRTRFESRHNYPDRNLQMHKYNPDGILNPQPRLIQGSNPRQTQKSPEQIARGFKYPTDLRFGRSNPGATELVGAEVPPAPNARSASASPARPGPT